MALDNYRTNKHGIEEVKCPLDSQAKALIEKHCQNHKPV